jgi:Na+/melibiose symporter-like transporter
MAVTTTPAPTATKQLGLAQYAGYAAGDAANNLAFSMSSLFLLLYYTDVVGLSAAAVGTMFLVVRFWDAVTDLFAGRMVDKASTRWGKFRPFILFGGIPLLLLSVATFTVPNGLHGTGGALVYAYLTYALLGLVYSLVNIPYGSLAAAMTQVPTERAKLATWRVYGSNLTILMLAFVVAPAAQGLGRPATLAHHHHWRVRGGRRDPVPDHLPHRQGAGPARRPQRQPPAELLDPEDQPTADHAVHLQPVVPHRHDRGTDRRRLLRPRRPR